MTSIPQREAAGPARFSVLNVERDRNAQMVTAEEVPGHAEVSLSRNSVKRVLSRLLCVRAWRVMRSGSKTEYCQRLDKFKNTHFSLGLLSPNTRPAGRVVHACPRPLAPSPPVGRLEPGQSPALRHRTRQDYLPGHVNASCELSFKSEIRQVFPAGKSAVKGCSLSETPFGLPKGFHVAWLRCSVKRR